MLLEYTTRREISTMAERKAKTDAWKDTVSPDPLRGLVCYGIHELQKQDRPGSTGHVVEIVEVEVWGRKGRKHPSCFRYPDGRIEWMPGHDPNEAKAHDPQHRIVERLKAARRIPAFSRRPR